MLVLGLVFLVCKMEPVAAKKVSQPLLLFYFTSRHSLLTLMYIHPSSVIYRRIYAYIYILYIQMYAHIHPYIHIQLYITHYNIYIHKIM